MKKNMGSADRLIRIIIAAAIAVLYLTNIITGVWAIVSIILASVFVLTSFIGFCPLYLPFDINTNKKQ